MSVVLVAWEFISGGGRWTGEDGSGVECGEGGRDGKEGDGGG